MRRVVYLVLIGLASLALVRAARAASGDVTQLAPGVFFREESRGCNNGWVIFQDFVLVIDANFPAPAEDVVAAIKKTTNKPIRFVFDTHWHPDHTFGNAIYAQEGAIAVAHENCLTELMKRGPSSWADMAKSRADIAKSRLKLPGMAFPSKLVFDDGLQRVELLYNGHGHTAGDAVAYLPKQKILFTGDACVNGPYNYLGDSNTASWIRLLTTLQQLNVETIGPGHGPVGKRPLLEDQKQYFIELRRQIGALVKQGKSLEDVQKAVSIPRYEKWAGVKAKPADIEFVFGELKKEAEAAAKK
jgi:cyclase